MVTPVLGVDQSSNEVPSRSQTYGLRTSQTIKAGYANASENALHKVDDFSVMETSNQKSFNKLSHQETVIADGIQPAFDQEILPVTISERDDDDGYANESFVMSADTRKSPVVQSIPVPIQGSLTDYVLAKQDSDEGETYSYDFGTADPTLV